MQEDIENRSLTLIINTSKLTARTLAAAFMKFLRYSKGKVQAHQLVKAAGKADGQKAHCCRIRALNRRNWQTATRRKPLTGMPRPVPRGLCHKERRFRGWQAPLHPVFQGTGQERHSSGDGRLLGGMGQTAKTGALCRRTRA